MTKLYILFIGAVLTVFSVTLGMGIAAIMFEDTTMEQQEMAQKAYYYAEGNKVIREMVKEYADCGMTAEHYSLEQVVTAIRTADIHEGLTGTLKGKRKAYPEFIGRPDADQYIRIAAFYTEDLR